MKRRTGRWLRGLAAGIDRALVSGVMTRPPRGGVEIDPLLEALERQVALHDEQAHWLQEPQGFFVPPRSVLPTRGAASTRQLGDGTELQVVDLRWPSKPGVHAASLAERWLAAEENRWAHARLFSRAAADGQRRPVAVLIHGYMGGHLAMEERIWPLEQFDARGLDVALLVLPHHGPRKGRGALQRPLFPSPDARLTVEGLRQSIFDLRALIDILRREGHPAVGLAGMSLGGYITALMATLEPELAFALPIIPLSCFATWYRDQDALVGEPEERRRHLEAIEALTRVVSPLARPSRLAPERVEVLGGLADQVTPIHHAERLAEHMGARLRRFSGGHLLQVGRSQALAQALQRVAP